MAPVDVDPRRVRELLAAHGRLEPQEPSDWTGEVPLPEPIAAFYRDVGPVDVTIEGYGNPYHLPRLAGLWDYQAGYRWNSLTGEASADWNPDWLVVADEGADPFIFAAAEGVVLYAVHGVGAWDPVELYPSLNTMAACLATLGSVVVAAGDGFTDDDCDVRPEHRATAVRRLTELLGDAARAEEIVDEAGWSTSSAR